MIAVVGAGAMGTALAIVHARAGLKVALLGTKYDDAAIAACVGGQPHPALGVTLDERIDCRAHDGWDEVLAGADTVVLGVSSDGLADVVDDLTARVSSDAVWVIATKGWDADSLRTPSEVVGSAIGSDARVVVLAGPALAPELVAGAPSQLVCASTDLDVARHISDSLAPAGVSMSVTDDVVGAEIAAAYKNVTAIAVGMCEGLSEHQPENVFVHKFANARAAMFAHGLEDMSRLAQARGGRLETILGLAGAGDLYVTCLGGRNGNFGRLLGAGQTPEQAQETIGSTVEGVPNTKVALAIADELGVDLVAARAVDCVLSGKSSPRAAVNEALALR